MRVKWSSRLSSPHLSLCVPRNPVHSCCHCPTPSMSVLRASKTNVTMRCNVKERDESGVKTKAAKATGSHLDRISSASWERKRNRWIAAELSVDIRKSPRRSIAHRVLISDAVFGAHCNRITGSLLINAPHEHHYNSPAPGVHRPAKSAIDRNKHKIPGVAILSITVFSIFSCNNSSKDGAIETYDEHDDSSIEQRTRDPPQYTLPFSL